MRTSFVSASPTKSRLLASWALSAFCIVGGMAVLTGCKQNVGERCQLTDDCAPGLVCEFGGNTPAMGGYCKDPNRTTGSTVDMGTPDQATPSDMSSMMSSDM